MRIEIHPYTTEWPVLFKQEKAQLDEGLAHLRPHIEHVGSTSVVGLAAKPIIDIMIRIPDFNEADLSVAPTQNLGYTYISDFEYVMPFRRFFIKSKNGSKTHHVHLVEKHSEFWRRHLAFRNHLRENKEDRIAYERLKIQLSHQEWESGNHYSAAKTEFIKGIKGQLEY